AGSLIHSIADSDRPGIRIAVVRNHASTAALSRVLKHAELVYAETPDTTLELLRSQAGRCNGISPSLLLLFPIRCAARGCWKTAMARSFSRWRFERSSPACSPT